MVDIFSIFLVQTDNTVSSKAPEFLKPLHDVETFIGNSVKFRCKINGYPNPKVLWFKDGKRLKPSDAVKMGEACWDIITTFKPIVFNSCMVILHSWL